MILNGWNRLSILFSSLYPSQFSSHLLSHPLNPEKKRRSKEVSLEMIFFLWHEQQLQTGMAHAENWIVKNLIVKWASLLCLGRERLILDCAAEACQSEWLWAFVKCNLGDVTLSQSPHSLFLVWFNSSTVGQVNYTYYNIYIYPFCRYFRNQDGQPWQQDQF